MMIDLKTYVEYTNDPELFALHINEIREYNKSLIEKYPWVEIKNKEECNPYPEEEFVEDMRYNWTWLDGMLPGWRLAFSEQMCEELQKELERVDYVNEYVILDVKEKWGMLRWSTAAIPIDSELFEIATKYEDLSENICVDCGEKAEYISKGYICPFCKKCRDKAIEISDWLSEDSFVPITK